MDHNRPPNNAPGSAQLQDGIQCSRDGPVRGSIIGHFCAAARPAETDLGAAIQGGLGFAASANINPDRTAPSMFEPVHGSAPDIAGQNIANPIAAIWSVAQMLEHLGEGEASSAVLSAIEAATAKGIGCRPGASSTQEITAAVIAALEA